VPANAIIQERQNMAYSSSVVMRGNGDGVVVATGSHTQVGRIAKEIEQTPTEITPLKRKLNRLAKALSLVGGIVCIIIIGVGLMYSVNEWVETLYVATAL
jgi:Ca2+-transporting ATPase